MSSFRLYAFTVPSTEYVRYTALHVLSSRHERVQESSEASDGSIT